MFKLTLIVSVLFIATWSQAVYKRHKKEATASDHSMQGTTIWAASLSCESCGSECVSACGTKHFRSCCFNYLRKKREPDSVMLRLSNNAPKPKIPYSIAENIPEQIIFNLIADEYKPYAFDDNVNDRLWIQDVLN